MPLLSPTLLRFHCVPVLPRRQLEALIRISESFARMSLAGEADDGHVAAAFDLFTKSTINAMNAGLISSSTERLEVSSSSSTRQQEQAVLQLTRFPHAPAWQPAVRTCLSQWASEVVMSYQPNLLCAVLTRACVCVCVMVLPIGCWFAGECHTECGGAHL